MSEEEFQGLIAARGEPLFAVTNYVSRNCRDDSPMGRPLVGRLLSLSAQFEEFLDACGARHNRRWHRFRSLSATIKRFAEISYELLHINHVLPSYRVRPIEQDFATATRETIIYTCGILRRTCAEMAYQARERGLAFPDECREAAFEERLADGLLPQDRASRKLESVAQTVTQLATAFLNLASDTEQIHAASRAKREEYTEYIPGTVSEKSLRFLQLQFHSLQSLYDTNVSDTQVEELDADLPVLRGHISVVFHLLRTATAMAHFYERHVNPETGPSAVELAPLVHSEELLAVLMEYSITFASLFIESAQTLCQEMLQRYAKVGEIEVSIPRYRGFHVRPSTLVAKIVLHYGSEVRIVLDDEPHDASKPIEIFRVNEKINARKRRCLAHEIARHMSVESIAQNGDVQALARRIVLALAEEGEVIIYEQPLRFPKHPVRRDGAIEERIIDEIIRLQTVGMIDIDADVSICFTGDLRVLEDIELLAKTGYGEDNFGNNINLPEELSYLRR